MRWHIGDGKSVRITKDPWLPLSSPSYSLSAQNVVDSTERVSVLIHEDSQSWNREAIYGLFSEWEASVICSIPLPPRPKPDRLFWNDTKTGIFTVKSAYHLQMQAQSAATEGECSSVGKDRKFWKFLWSMSIPPKVKAFLWRACLGILPANELLCRRHLKKDGLCPCCLIDVESVAHCLWSCMAANDVWLETGLKLQKWDRFIPSFFDLMMFLPTRLSQEEVNMFACVAYFIWGQ